MTVKAKATEVALTTKRVATNAEQFVQAVSLLTIAGFSYHAINEIALSKPAYYTVYAALVVIGVRGAIELFKFLDKKD